jgi:ABC-type histidine transport system ATPase subunit
MAQPILQIENLHKKFKDTEVLKGVDLQLATGDVVSIIGSSGSGKTTLLRCVNMLEDSMRVMIEARRSAIPARSGRGGDRRQRR